MTRRALTGPATEYVAGELRAQKARLNWTFDDLARVSGVPRSTAERSLKGEHAIAVEVLLMLASAMRMDVRELMEAASLL